MRLGLTSNAAFVLFITSVVAAEAADMPVGPVVAPIAAVLSPRNAFYVGGFIGASVATQTANEQGANQRLKVNPSTVQAISMDPLPVDASDAGG
jgi:hypothetical protein